MEKNILTENQMIHILENNLINECDCWEQEQVYAFAFGEEFMTSIDKGEKVAY